MHKLYMLLVGATPPGRHTEQHDVFFGIAPNIRELLPQVKDFWPEGLRGLHLDAWREVRLVDGYAVHVMEGPAPATATQLFFINLGGYKQGEFEEFHYKMIVAAADKGAAVQLAKDTAFFRHTGFKGATSHIDDKWGVDVDDIHAIPEILPASTRAQYHLSITQAPPGTPEDRLHLGYFKLDTVDKWAPR